MNGKKEKAMSFGFMALTILMPPVSAVAVTYTIGEGQSMSAAGVPPTLSTGSDTFQFQGATASLTAAITKPDGTLIFDSQPTGTTINLASGGTFNNSAPTTTFEFNNITTLSGGGNRAILSSPALNIDIDSSGSLTLSNMALGSSDGGALLTFNTLNVSGGGQLILDSNRATTGSGGAIIAYGGVSVAGDLTATGNQAGNDGGAVFTFGPATIDGNFTATGNQAGGSGGAIIAYGGVSVTGDFTATGNRATNGAGGAIWAGGSGVTLGTNGNTITLTDNTAATEGGAIRTDSLTINGDLTATGNRANSGEGGAIYAVSGAVTVHGNLTLGGIGTGEGNTASASGGAVRAAGILTVDGNLTATGNHAGGSGGAIVAYGGAIVSGDLTVSGNTAVNDGGAIWTTTGTNVMLGSIGVGNTFILTDNAAGGSGGGILTYGSAIASGDLTATDNRATTGSGGAIYAAQSVTLGTAGNAFTLANNTAGGNGGAIYADTGDVTVNGDLILGGPGVGNSAQGNGGAITARSAGVTVNGNVTADSNQSLGGQGGAIWATTDVTLGMNAGNAIILTNNTAADSGGAITTHGNVTLHGNVTADSNQSLGGQGGGTIWTVADVTLGTDATNTIILAGNTAQGAGGAISAGGGAGNPNGHVTVNGNLFASDNHAITGEGGGTIWASNDVTLGVAGASNTFVLADNTALSGGAILTHGTLAVNGDLTAAGNTSTVGDGGAIWAGTGVTLGLAGAGNTFILTDNTAGDAGGAILAYGAVTVNGDLLATGNRASSGDGGGAIWTADNVTLGIVGAGNTITLANNTAATSGSGGAILAHHMVTVDGILSATDNTAAGTGGAIWGHAGVMLNLTGASTINDNTAGASGGALASLMMIDVHAMSGDISFTNNRAGNHGGAIYLDPDSSMLNGMGGDIILNATGGDIIFSGNTQGTAGIRQANAVYVDNVASDPTVRITLATAAGRQIAFYDPIANNVAQGLVAVVKDGAGMVSFDGKNYTDSLDRWSQVYALTQVDEGIFEVANNAVYGMRAVDAGQSDASTFTMAPGTLLQGGVAGTVSADQVMLDGATLDIAGRQPGVRGTFTIDSTTLTLGTGSRVLFNTELNSGAVQNTDLLVLNHGATVGTASVLVNNVNGTGALTVGNGIRLVQAENGATTGQDSFVLGNRVAAGAYEYQLYRSGVAGDTPDDWYLRSTIVSSPHPDGTLPNYRMEVPVYMTAPALANRMGLAMLGTYHDRVGEDRPEQWHAGASDRKSGADEPTGNKAGWGRAFGEFGSVGQVNNGSASDSDTPAYDFDLSGLQVGMDVLRNRHANDSRDIVGVYVGMTHGQADVQRVYSDSGAGQVSMDGYTLGGYWTHKGPSEWYVDTVLQGTRYTNAEAESVLGSEIHPDGWGITASLEGGYPFVLGRGWALEPQAQIVYQWISLDNDVDAFGQVRFADINTWLGRVGARLTKDWTSRNGRQGTVWARANVWHSFGSDAETTFASLDASNPVSLDTTLGGTWGQVGLGVAAQVTNRLTLYATGDYNATLDSGTGHSVSARIGLRYEF